MNLLDLVPSFKRQLGLYVKTQTDSQLAGYIADAIDALNWRWSRSYEVTYIPPHSYTVDPDITVRDRRPVILMASIMFKIGNIGLASIRDGDFAYDPGRTRDPLSYDLAELKLLLPEGPRLQAGFTVPLRGFSNVWNIESYQYIFDRIA
jgi:hypothetical protein